MSYDAHVKAVDEWAEKVCESCLEDRDEYGGLSALDCWYRDLPPIVYDAAQDLISEAETGERKEMLIYRYLYEASSEIDYFRYRENRARSLEKDRGHFYQTGTLRGGEHDPSL